MSVVLGNLYLNGSEQAAKVPALPHLTKLFSASLSQSQYDFFSKLRTVILQGK